MEEFMQAISGARYTYYDEFERVFFVWHRGTMVRIFNDEGVECECFNMDTVEPDVSEVQAAIGAYVADHYSELEREDRYYNDLSDDAEALASAGMGTDEDYGYYGGDD